MTLAEGVTVARVEAKLSQQLQVRFLPSVFCSRLSELRSRTEQSQGPLAAAAPAARAVPPGMAAGHPHAGNPTL